ncbi:MAG: carboxymuconolactone decarboxylase family protein [Actinomycetes bacterium]|jgi:4-carboxymuconolactone decarboxylase
MMAEPEEQLRRLALHDEECIRSVLAMDLKDDGTSGLDPKTHALIRLGALLALGAAPVSYHWTVGAALDAGATAEEILGTLIAVAPISGVARVVLAIPDVALPIGYDIDAAFEELDDDPP